MDISWRLPKISRTGKPIDEERLNLLYKAGIKPEDAFNIILGGHKDIKFIDKVLYTPLSEDEIEKLFLDFKPNSSNLKTIRDKFKNIIFNMYDGLKDDISNSLILDLWPEEEDDILKRPKNKNAITLNDETEDGIIEKVYESVHKIAKILYNENINKNDWNKIKTSYEDLMNYLQKIIEDPTPNKEMRNIVDRMALMAYRYEAGSFGEISGSRDENIIKELFEPSKIHPSIDINPEAISEYGYLKIDELNKFSDSLSEDTTETISTIMIDEGQIQIEEDSLLSTLKEADVIEGDFNFDFIAGKD